MTRPTSLRTPGKPRIGYNKGAGVRASVQPFFDLGVATALIREARDVLDDVERAPKVQHDIADLVARMNAFLQTAVKP